MAYLGNGIYDLLDVVRASKNPQINYEGLYQDAPSNIATSNLFQAMQPGYEYRNSNFINNLIDKSGFDLSGNVPIDFNRQVDFKNYFNNEPLRSNYESLARFQNFNPRVGNITPLVKNTDPLNVNEGIMSQVSKSLGFDTSFDVANKDDVEQNEKKPNGIADFFRAALGYLIPGSGLFMGDRSALQGIQSLNQRLRNTDFGQSKTLQEYLQRREARKDSERLQTVGQQLQQASERGGGYQPTTEKQNIARTESRVRDGKTRAYGL
jgi:hypothetical protein